MRPTIAPSVPTTVDRPNGLQLAVCGLIFLGILRLVPLVATSGFHNDFSHYYLGGWMFANGINAYTEPLEHHCARLGTEVDPTIPHAAHPPLILAMFAVLSEFSPETAYGVWLVAQFVILVGFLEVTRRLLGWEWSDYPWLVVVAIFCNSTSLQNLFYFSQIQLLVGLLAYLALAAHLQTRHVVACGLITLAAAIKIYPLVLLPWFCCAGVRNRSDISLRLSTVAVVTITCLTLSGISTWIDFVTIGIPGLAEHAVQWTNVSVQSFAYQISQAGLGTTQPLGGYTKVLVMLISVSVIGLAYLAAFVGRPRPRVAFCILLAASTVGGLITWSHYFTLMLFPVALLWQTTAKSSSPGTRTLAIVAGALVLMPQLDSLLFAFAGNDTVGRVLLQFYTLFAVAIVSVLLRLSDRSPNVGAAS